MAKSNVKRPKIRRRIKWGQICVHIMLIALLIMVLFPFYILIVNSFKKPVDIMQNPLGFPGAEGAEIGAAAYEAAWNMVSGYIINSFIIAFIEVVGVLAFASLAAYGFSRFNFKGKNVLFTLFLAFMMIPSILTLATQYSLVYTTLELKQSIWGVILPTIAGGMPINIFLIKTFFDGIPKGVYEAAEIDGASKLQCFFKIALPLSKPILFTVGLSTFLGSWNDIIWSNLILYGKPELYTIGVGVFRVLSSSASRIPDTVMYAGYCIASIPLVVAFFFTSKQFIKGLTEGAIKM